MRARSILLILLGSKTAILDAAHSRWTLLIGGLLVISAGLARNYDGEDLLREPGHLLGPFVASIATSFGLFTLLMAIAGTMPTRRQRLWVRWQLYPRFLALYWMTAPLAWLYAIPYDRFLTPVEAIDANMWTLALVATWRVVLITRVVSVLTRTAFWPLAVWVGFYGATVMFIAVLASPKPILDIMGGLRLPPEDRRLTSMMMNLGFWSLVAIPTLLLAGTLLVRRIRPQWPPERFDAGRVPVWPALLAALVCIAAWAPALGFAQPEQRLRREVELAMAAGNEPGAVAILSSHHREEFPPHWVPPPRRGWRNSPGSLARVLDAIERDGAAPWVIGVYLVEAQVATGDDQYIGYDDANWFGPFERWSEYSEYRAQASTAVALRFVLNHDPNLTGEQRSRIERVLSQPERFERDANGPAR